MTGIDDPHLCEQSGASSDPDIVSIGYRRRGRAIAEKRPDRERLTPKRSVERASHSPDEFDWGYSGGGPA